MTDMILNVINEFALQHGGVMSVRPHRLRKDFLKMRLTEMPYFILEGVILTVIDGRRPTNDKQSPYILKRFDIADPESFNQVEKFLSEANRATS